MLDQTDGKQVAFNLTAGVPIVKVGSGRVVTVSVIVSAAASSAIYDAATTGAAAVGNQLMAIPASATGIFTLNMPFQSGLVVVPGAGVTLAISYN
jgi:hypothetical protein